MPAPTPEPAPARRLVLFTKPAVAGRVKTRLTPELSGEEAAALHAAFLGDLLDRLAGGDFRLRLAWALEPDEPVPPAPIGAGAAFEAVRQAPGDLGERLDVALADAAADAPAVAALGSDHPTVPLATIEEAFRRIEAGADAVIGPSADGGYYLIALAARALAPGLFAGIDWSTDRVYAQQTARLDAAGLAWQALPTGRDVDTPDDLAHLASVLAATRADSGTTPACPRTRRLLAAWGRL